MLLKNVSSFLGRVFQLTSAVTMSTCVATTRVYRRINDVTGYDNALMEMMNIYVPNMVGSP